VENDADISAVLSDSDWTSEDATTTNKKGGRQQGSELLSGLLFVRLLYLLADSSLLLFSSLYMTQPHFLGC
jgi:hypothetical protein